MLGHGKSPKPGERWSALSLTPPLTGTLTSRQCSNFAKTRFSHASNGDNTSGSAGLVELWWDKYNACRSSYLTIRKSYVLLLALLFTPGEDCIELTCYVST